MHYRHLVAMLAGLLSYTTLPAQESPAAAADGKLVYETHCLACHQADGSGVPNLAPPIVNGPFVNGDKKELIEIVLNGMEGVEIKGETYFNPMPPFDYLTDEEVAAVLTYIRTHFDNNASAITPDDVQAVRNP